MSLMKTLARVAAGVMVAKGVGAMMKNASGGQSRTASNRSTGGGLLGQILQGQQSRAGQSGGGLGDVLGQVLGGGAGAGTGARYGGANSRGAQGGLGGLLDQLSNQARGGAGAAGAQGGLGDLLSQMTGGRGASTGAQGGLGDLLGGLMGAGAAGAAAGGLAQRGAQPTNDASFGELFNDSVARGGEPEIQPTPEQNAVAGLMLKAMIQAAKSDGKIDDAEKERLLGELGDLDDQERAFIREQMAAPVDPKGLAREVPKGLEQQVYMMSVMAIDFDNQNEAQYLHALAQALGMQPQMANAIHEHLGVQNLYS